MKNLEEKYLLAQKLLALERTNLSNEKNTLAYIRTGFASFLFGIGLIKLFEDSPSIVYVGFGALILGALFIILGLVWYPIRKKRIKSY